MIKNKVDCQVDLSLYWEMRLEEISFGVSGTGLTHGLSVEEGKSQSRVPGAALLTDMPLIGDVCLTASSSLSQPPPILGARTKINQSTSQHLLPFILLVSSNSPLVLSVFVCTYVHACVQMLLACLLFGI